MSIKPTIVPFLFFAVTLCPLVAKPKPQVVVSIPPQKAFVYALVGEAVELQVLLQPGQSPENFALSPKLMSKLANADVYFGVGAPMEDFVLPRIESSYPHIQIVDTSAGIRKRSLNDHTHDDPHDDHGHTHVTDPHVWLSPGLAKIQLRHYSRKLKEIVPDLSETIDQNAERFLEKVNQVDKELAEKLKDLRGNTIFVYHPSFGYFLNRYGLRQETVELQGKPPTAKQLQTLISKAKEHQVKVIFIQPQFQSRSAQALAQAIGGTVEELDPLAEDYLANLSDMGEAIARSFR